MEDPILELRRWLQHLSPEDARRLAEADPIRSYAHLAQAGSARRAAASVQAWASRASNRDLRTVAEYGVGWAKNVLERSGWPDEAVANPDRDQLTDMLLGLEPAIAVLAVFGLMVGDFPASHIAITGSAELLAAARSPRRNRPDPTSGDGGEPPVRIAGQGERDEDELLADELLADARRAGATLSEAAVNGLDFADAMAAFEEARELLREHLAAMGIAWNAADGFDHAKTRIAEHTEQRRVLKDESAAREQEITALRKRREQLSGALSSDVPPEVRVAFENEAARIDAKLATLASPQLDMPASREPAVAAEAAAAPRSP
ncbi:MAG: hypothetical protein ACJ786_13875, partial [Catenulispora sp.]